MNFQKMIGLLTLKMFFWKSPRVISRKNSDFFKAKLHIKYKEYQDIIKFSTLLQYWNWTLKILPDFHWIFFQKLRRLTSKKKIFFYILCVVMLKKSGFFPEMTLGDFPKIILFDFGWIF